MKHNLKTLGLALGAVLALGALFAAGASAQGERFHSTEESVVLTGESNASEFRIGNNSTEEGLAITCETVTYEGTVEGEEFNEATETWTSKEVTVHPVYDWPCETPVGLAEIDTSGCDYVLTSERNFQVTESQFDQHAPVEVECTELSAIEVTATGCTIKIGSIPEETLTTGVTYTNIGTGHEKTITIDATIDSIPFTSAGFLCGFAGIPKEGHNGFYEDDIVVEGVKDVGGPCKVHAITHELEGCEEGAEVGIWWL